MRFLSLFLVIFSFLGCSSAYYAAMEQVGVHKRDIMVDRVEAASLAQEEAGEEFQTALDSLLTLTNYDGGDLEKMYTTINNSYKNSLAAADEVSESIDDIEDVAGALFTEWQNELMQYNNENLRLSSEKKLEETKVSYQVMLTAMKKAEEKMQPVLATLHDNTLFLKHNLNAAAINALESEFQSLEIDISNAIAEMQDAINESQKFIAKLQ